MFPHVQFDVRFLTATRVLRYLSFQTCGSLDHPQLSSRKNRHERSLEGPPPFGLFNHERGARLRNSEKRRDASRTIENASSLTSKALARARARVTDAPPTKGLCSHRRTHARRTSQARRPPCSSSARSRALGARPRPRRARAPRYASNEWRRGRASRRTARPNSQYIWSATLYSILRECLVVVRVSRLCGGSRESSKSARLASRSAALAAHSPPFPNNYSDTVGNV